MAETTRRKFLHAAAGVAIASAAPAAGLLGSNTSYAATAGPVRWGVVGTGGIANSMARMIKLAEGAELAAVSSRRMETAREYGAQPLGGIALLVAQASESFRLWTGNIFDIQDMAAAVEGFSQPGTQSQREVN